LIQKRGKSRKKVSLMIMNIGTRCK